MFHSTVMNSKQWSITVHLERCTIVHCPLLYSVFYIPVHFTVMFQCPECKTLHSDSSLYTVHHCAVVYKCTVMDSKQWSINGQCTVMLHFSLSLVYSVFSILVHCTVMFQCTVSDSIPDCKTLYSGSLLYTVHHCAVAHEYTVMFHCTVMDSKQWNINGQCTVMLNCILSITVQ